MKPKTSTRMKIAPFPLNARLCSKRITFKRNCISHTFKYVQKAAKETFQKNGVLQTSQPAVSLFVTLILYSSVFGPISRIHPEF